MYWDSVFSCLISDWKSMPSHATGETQHETSHKFMQLFQQTPLRRSRYLLPTTLAILWCLGEVVKWSCEDEAYFPPQCFRVASWIHLVSREIKHLSLPTQQLSSSYSTAAPLEGKQRKWGRSWPIATRHNSWSRDLAEADCFGNWLHFACNRGAGGQLCENRGCRVNRQSGFLLLLIYPIPLLCNCNIMFKSRQQTVKALHIETEPLSPLVSCLVKVMLLKRK